MLFRYLNKLILVAYHSLNAIKNILKIILVSVIVFSCQQSYAAGPSEEFMRNIEVPSYRIENFKCLENCETIFFLQNEKVFHEASKCPYCEEIELTFQHPNDSGVFKNILYGMSRNYDYIKQSVYGNLREDFQRFQLFPNKDCTTSIRFRGKLILLSLEPEVDGDSCKTIVKSAECKGDNCSNLRIYTYEDIHNYRERLLYSSCQNASTCQGYNMSHGYYFDDYGVVLDNYHVDFENQHYDINNAIGNERNSTQKDKTIRIPVKDLKQRTTITDKFGDSVVQFDLVTDDFQLLEKALGKDVWNIIFGIFLVLLGGGAVYGIYKAYSRVKKANTK